MKNRIIALLCAVMLALGALSPPAFASQSKTHYPVSVEEYTEDGTDAHRIKKVYQLSISDDPAGIPTEDFERDSVLYHLLDLTMKNEIGVDTKDYSETITQDSSIGDMAAVLKQLDAQREVTTEDGYTGVLLLDHTTVNVKAKGYSTSTKNLTASRTYPNLADADLSLVPKTVTEGGKTLTLGNVQWSNSYDEGGAAHYTASATYTGTATSRYATGYTVTADYAGQVSKTSSQIVTYTAIFGAVQPAEAEPEAEPEQNFALAVKRTVEPEAQNDSEQKTDAPINGSRALSIAGCAGGIASLAAAAYWSVEKIKERKKAE